MSAQGAMLGGAKFPPEGSAVTLRRGDLQVTGTVTWRREGLAGLCFDSAVDVDSWVKHNGRLAARKIHEGGESKLVEHLRELQRETDRVTFAWVSNRLAEISERLANSAPMRLELAEALIEIDALSALLRSGCASPTSATDSASDAAADAGTDAASDSATSTD